VPDVDGVADGVPEGVGEFDLVPEPDGVGEKVGVGVPLGSAPADGVPVCEGVGLGGGSTTPWTYKGDVYMVPALVTGFH